LRIPPSSRLDPWLSLPDGHVTWSRYRGGAGGESKGDTPFLGLLRVVVVDAGWAQVPQVGSDLAGTWAAFRVWGVALCCCVTPARGVKFAPNGVPVAGPVLSGNTEGWPARGRGSLGAVCPRVMV
jgi:hypothetical protein